MGYSIGSNEVYGSALVKAYTSESKEAKYPRIVVGESLWEYINYVDNLKCKTECANRAKSIAKQCKNWVVKDLNYIHSRCHRRSSKIV